MFREDVDAPSRGCARVGSVGPLADFEALPRLSEEKSPCLG